MQSWFRSQAPRKEKTCTVQVVFQLPENSLYGAKHRFSGTTTACKIHTQLCRCFGVNDGFCSAWQKVSSLHFALHTELNPVDCCVKFLNIALVNGMEHASCVCFIHSHLYSILSWDKTLTLVLLLLAFCHIPLCECEKSIFEQTVKIALPQLQPVVSALCRDGFSFNFQEFPSPGSSWLCDNSQCCMQAPITVTG